MGIIVNQTQGASSSNSSAVSNVDWILPTSIDLQFSKGFGTSLSKSFSMVFKDYIATDPVDTLTAEFSFTGLNPFVLSFQNTFQFDTQFLMTDAIYGDNYNLILNFANANLALPGTYTGEIFITITKGGGTLFYDDKTIPVNITVIDAGELDTNLSPELNFCLDPDLFLNVTSNLAKYVSVLYSIYYKGKTKDFKYQYAVIDDNLSVKIGEAVQPYIYLDETEINNYFSNLMLDMAPAIVELKVKFLDINFVELNEYNLGNFNFHAGKFSNLPKYGEIIERSLNYNSYLPMAFQYQNQNVDFNFRGNTRTFNKQQFSQPLNIFQMFFIQKSHFADPILLGGFGPGFGNGFGTSAALNAAQPFHLYDEAYTNEIESYYTIKGYNFPIETNALNVIWLDENNNFNGMTFTGAQTQNSAFIHLINSKSLGIANAKAGADRTKTITINTGWKLFKEIPLLASLLESKRCWVFGDTPESRIEVICTQKKLQEADTFLQLYDHTIEFEIYE